MRKSQVCGSKRGTVPACSTGHFSVSDWPGRQAARIAHGALALLAFCSFVEHG